MDLESNEIKLDYSDVLIRPKRSTLNSRSEVNLERTYWFEPTGRQWEGVPLMASNMDGVGNFSMAKALAKHKIMTVITKSHTHEEWMSEEKFIEENADHICISSGTSEDDFTKLQKIIQDLPMIKFICVDVANGYSEHFSQFCKKVREHFPDKILIAGNVVTREMTEELILNGVDIVKVGIGPGQMCLTRSQTGVGYPQLSAVSECADAAHGLGGRIIADGGCSTPGDIAKAFGGGADFVMLGSMFAATKEGSDEVFEKDGKQYVKFYGMSSKTAQEKQGDVLSGYRASEGRTVEMPFRGSIDDIVQDILGGVRSTCSYVGARNLKELDRCVTFIRVNNQINKNYEKYDNGQK